MPHATTIAENRPQAASPDVLTEVCRTGVPPENVIWAEIVAC